MLLLVVMIPVLLFSQWREMKDHLKDGTANLVISSQQRGSNVVILISEAMWTVLYISCVCEYVSVCDLVYIMPECVGLCILSRKNLETTDRVYKSFYSLLKSEVR